MKYVYDKLVRDDVPRLIEEKGHKVKTRLVEGPELFEYLCKKLIEESEEFKDNRTVYDLADLFEVIYSIMDQMGVTLLDLWEAYDKKAFERGCITKGVVLEYVEEE